MRYSRLPRQMEVLGMTHGAGRFAAQLFPSHIELVPDRAMTGEFRGDASNHFLTDLR
ncbi:MULTISPECIES: hypothetical protein [unclassified Pseudomonas]|uniref:hypothetical protein n=1 Tax=Pseudomonas sp. MH10 TaxID=3048627 RepID=UPI002AC9E696|nr:MULTISPECIES: hypothetical protein [unclassified Pseudomonas]MEB0043071.1 hypothetical protein [Pseudomonas sp. MH10]MEB0121462.1 hypothetical protein [Pseudomonas sp. CCI1.2]WPX66631.1 hypothetical protein RHM59_25020 [Pseudomonas sp. MH10]